MNKLKEAAAALRGHLGRDERGHELLEQLTRLAHEQRKELTAEKERSASLERVAQDLRRQLAVKDATIGETARLAREEAALRKQADNERNALAASLNEAQEEIAKLQPADLEPYQLPAERPQLSDILGSRPDDDVRINPKELTEEFNWLRKAMRVCPYPLDPAAISRRIAYYNLESIITHFSHNELLKLGRFVAVRALFDFPCGILSDYAVMTDASNMASMEPFIRWFTSGVRMEDLTRIFTPREIEAGKEMERRLGPLSRFGV